MHSHVAADQSKLLAKKWYQILKYHLVKETAKNFNQKRNVAHLSFEIDSSCRIQSNWYCGFYTLPAITINGRSKQTLEPYLKLRLRLTNLIGQVLMVHKVGGLLDRLVRFEVVALSYCQTAQLMLDAHLEALESVRGGFVSERERR